jgi:glycine/D-amino acid oxidase-like deaminating enzyme
MSRLNTQYDAIVIGGGFYGAVIAIYLAKVRNFKRIALLEQEADILTRASFNNQARVHNGYHYPRSFTTAYRSRINLPKFIHDWPQAVIKDFTKVYAIARRNSKITARQFFRFCKEIGAKIESAEPSLRRIFEPRLIEDVFLVEEYVFDSSKLSHLIKGELKNCGVEVFLNAKAKGICKKINDSLVVAMEINGRPEESITSHYAFNCTYSGLNQFARDLSAIKGLKHEIAELALVKVPPQLNGLGVTIMDGPFFSIMPFPPRNLHSLSHVRYTPHLSWEEGQQGPEYKIPTDINHSRANLMIRDAARFIPEILKVKHIDSLFEIKTLLMRNEINDGRPILFEKHKELDCCYSVLGGKIDNIYDILEKLNAEFFQKVKTVK